MKTINVSEATNTQLDWLVAKCEGFVQDDDPAWERGYEPFSYSTDWSQMGPIIEREKLQVSPHFLSAGYEHPQGLWEWEAYVLGPNNIDGNFEQHGPTSLIAAARCYVASKLGENVEVPEELT